MEYLTIKPISLFLLACLVLTACASAPSRTRNADSPADTPAPSHAETRQTAPAPASTPLTDAPSTTSATNDIWQRLREGFALPDAHNPRIQAELDWYLQHPLHLQRICERARPFLYDIIEVFEQHNIPLDIALLPAIESAFQPYSYSPGRATGLWQFIPSTGAHMGLAQNWWYDGRRDPYAATRAAARYLLSVNARLKGDWLHTLAGFNAGPGHVRKASRHNRQRGQSSDYWQLSLPGETMRYVPKLLALRNLIHDPQQYGIRLCDIPNQPALARVTLNGQLDLAIAADLAQISIDELYALNPGFNQWATPPAGPHHLLLPLDRADTFRLAESALPKAQRLRWQRHTIQPGQTLSHIALQYRTTVAEIKKANQLGSDQLRTGRHLLIPTAKQAGRAYTFSSEQRQQRRLNAKGKGHKQIYVVKAGDSWWRIARRYQVSHQQLARWNGQSPLDTLRPGQKLAIWSNNTQPGPTSVHTTQKLRYPVRRGDSLSVIAEKFKVSVKDIVNWNRLRENKYLQPGQRLVIYVDVTRQSTRL